MTLKLPEMDGFEFCEAVHADSTISMAPFVVMSSRTDRSYMSRMVEIGAAAYICKPFNIDELVILIEKILSDQFLLLLKEKERLELEQHLIVGSIASLIAALEARDKYTKGHSESVGRIVSGMVAMTGASRKEVETATIGGRLHDIGKIGIRDEITIKARKVVGRRVFPYPAAPRIIGANILKSIPSFSDILPIVLSHHERMDGKGYPHGLKGDRIHLWSRMTAVADTYDALTSDRPYRRGMSHEKAMQIIEDVRGTQLCPDCVDLFFRWIEQDRPKLPNPHAFLFTVKLCPLNLCPSINLYQGTFSQIPIAAIIVADALLLNILKHLDAPFHHYRCSGDRKAGLGGSLEHDIRYPARGAYRMR